MTDAAPVPEASRIKTLDVMRGFAVLGILIVNAAFFAAPWQTAINPTLAPLAVTSDTLWSWAVMHVGFEFKCITLFSILFGASLYLGGGDGTDAARNALLNRRLLWLLAFGLVHALFIWYGDILVVYAVTGLLVAPARAWPVRTLLTRAITLLVLSLALSTMLGALFAQTAPEQLNALRAQVWAPAPAEMARFATVYRGALVSATQENIATWLQFISTSPYLIIRTAGLMLLGMALLKMGFLSGTAPRWVYFLMLALGAVALAIIGYQAAINARLGFPFVHMESFGSWPNTALSLFVTLGYASALVLLVHAGARFITEPLAAVGRMAFTNYLTQSLIMTTIFWGGRGFGLYAHIDRPTLMGIVAAVWVLQLIWSVAWLSYFQMGPLEWLWRRLSYGRPLAITKRAAA